MNLAVSQQVKESDHYAINLAEVNKVNTVTTTENIYNQQGVLIVAKGAEVDARAYQTIIKHKLQKPIENSIQLDNTLTPENIYFQFTTITSHPELRKSHAKEMNITQFISYCQQLQKYPLLLQKLTVLQARFPMHYRKTIFGAFVSLSLCQEQNLSFEVTNNTFLAALFRDLGLLHIDASVVEKTGKLSADEWKLLQGHVPISYNVAKLIPDVPAPVPRAVLEHHETTDGFGYPFYKVESKLSLEGQIVAFADTYVALFHKHIFDGKLSFRELEPILQINAGVNLHQNTEAALRIIRRYSSPIDSIKNETQVINLAEKLLLKQPIASQWFDDALQFNKLLVAKHSNSNLEKTSKFIDRQQSILLRSGICDDLFLNWLSSIDLNNIEKSDALEIQESWLMLNEILWQFEQLIKTFKAIMMELQAPDNELAIVHEQIDLLQDKLTLLKL